MCRHSGMKRMDCERWGLVVTVKKYRATSASHHVKHAMCAAVVALVHPQARRPEVHECKGEHTDTERPQRTRQGDAEGHSSDVQDDARRQVCEATFQLFLLHASCCASHQQQQ